MIPTCRCTYCGKIGEIEESVQEGSCLIAALSCQHTCTFDVDKDVDQSASKEMEMIAGQTKVCRGCDVRFLSRAHGAIGMFCPICRRDFGITSEHLAEEMVQLLLAVPQRQLAAAPIVVNPDVIAEGLRHMTAHAVGPIDTYEKPITYITHKNGLFEVRSSDLVTVTTRPKTVLGLTTEGKEGVTLNVPKMPFEILQKTISFFRGVIERQKGTSEALVQVWWDRETQQHVMHVPSQDVSGASVHHRSVFDQDSSGRWIHESDIHSHGAAMGAFWSGTDDRDEQRVSTERFFGVIGKVSQVIPEWKWRLRTRDGFIDLALTDLFEIPTAPIAFTIEPEIVFRSLSDPTLFKDGRVTLSCPVNPFPDVDVPADWYAQVVSQSHHFGYQSHLPHVMRGFIYINGEEYEVNDTSSTRTGHRLIPANHKEKDGGRI